MKLNKKWKIEIDKDLIYDRNDPLAAEMAKELQKPIPSLTIEFLKFMNDNGYRGSNNKEMDELYKKFLAFKKVRKL